MTYYGGIEMSSDNRIVELCEVVSELIEFSDWCYEENNGNYNEDRAKRNKFITGKRKIDRNSSIIIDDLNFGWNYNQNNAGKKLWPKGFLNTGYNNISYDRSDENNKKLVFSVNKEIKKEIYLLSDRPFTSEIKEIVKIFWSFMDEKRSKNVTTKKQKYLLEISDRLIKTKNVILRGAPGTGKTFIANQVAADIVTNGKTTEMNELNEDEKSRIGFVQFHPSYDYTDFVEGLRPSTSEDGVVSFTLKSGSFKSFIEKALKPNTSDNQSDFDEAWEKFFDTVTEASADGGYNKLKTLTGKPVHNLFAYERNEIQGVYPENRNIYLNHDQVYNVYRGLPGTPKGGFDTYRKAIVKHLKEEFGLRNYIESRKDSFNNQNYVFIIDEINRGEISKIFGELFFSIDPGYRGNTAGVYTQYASIHTNPEEKFFIPDNVYIIGTMNDIDRSVDTFDFAMRRRFSFIEITAKESADNMLSRQETKEIMMRLNEAIVNSEIGGLSTDYQIGASYFLGIDSDEESIEDLWQTKLYPLLKDYYRGDYKASDKIESLTKIYFGLGDSDES